MGSSTQSDKELKRIINKFLGKLNSNPHTNNYIGEEDDKNVADFLAALHTHTTKARVDELVRLSKQTGLTASQVFYKANRTADLQANLKGDKA